MNLVLKKGFAKEQLKDGLASVQRMKFLRIKIVNLTWHREYRFESIPTTVIGALRFKWELDFTW